MTIIDRSNFPKLEKQEDTGAKVVNIPSMILQAIEDKLLISHFACLGKGLGTQSAEGASTWLAPDTVVCVHFLIELARASQQRHVVGGLC